MSQLDYPERAFFFGSFLFREDLISEDEIKSCWENKWGYSQYFSHPYFPMKEYYSKEMGNSNLLKRFFGVALTLRERDEFLESKIWATFEEDSRKRKTSRVVNIDIGCLSLENLQLATGKPFAHRIYLGKGVYSDLTYLFRNKKYEVLPWTYPDYREKEVLNFFTEQRQTLYEKILYSRES